MKKILILLLFIVLCLNGCGGSSENNQDKAKLKSGDIFYYKAIEDDPYSMDKNILFGKTITLDNIKGIFAEKLNGKHAIWMTSGNNGGNTDDNNQWIELPGGSCYSTENENGSAWCYFPSRSPLKGTKWVCDNNHTAEITYVKTKQIQGKTETVYGYNITNNSTGNIDSIMEFCPKIGFFTIWHSLELTNYVKIRNTTK